MRPIRYEGKTSRKKPWSPMSWKGIITTCILHFLTIIMLFSRELQGKGKIVNRGGHYYQAEKSTMRVENLPRDRKRKYYTGKLSSKLQSINVLRIMLRIFLTLKEQAEKFPSLFLAIYGTPESTDAE